MNWRNHLEARFGNLFLTGLTPPVIYKWHQGYEKNPYAGNRSKAVLSKICSFAELKGYLSPGTNPCRSVPNHPEEKRSRYATDEEIQKVGEALDLKAAVNPREVAFLYLLLFTGSRPSAIERAKRRDLVQYGDSFVLSVAGKSGREHVVIPPQALAILEKLGVMGHDEESLLGIKFPRSFWEGIRKEVGCPDLWARDFRRTFATTGLSNDIPLETLSRLLNHKKQQTTMLYAKLIMDSRIEASRAIGNEILKKLRR